MPAADVSGTWHAMSRNVGWEAWKERRQQRKGDQKLRFVKTNFTLRLCVAKDNGVCLFGWLEGISVRRNIKCCRSST